MERLRLLAYNTGRVDQELLVRNEYLAAWNRILRVTLAEIAHRTQSIGGSGSLRYYESLEQHAEWLGSLF